MVLTFYDSGILTWTHKKTFGHWGRICMPSPKRHFNECPMSWPKWYFSYPQLWFDMHKNMSLATPNFWNSLQYYWAKFHPLVRCTEHFQNKIYFVPFLAANTPTMSYWLAACHLHKFQPWKEETLSNKKLNKDLTDRILSNNKNIDKILPQEL